MLLWVSWAFLFAGSSLDSRSLLILQGIDTKVPSEVQERLRTEDCYLRGIWCLGPGVPKADTVGFGDPKQRNFSFVRSKITSSLGSYPTWASESRTQDCSSQKWDGGESSALPAQPSHLPLAAQAWGLRGRGQPFPSFLWSPLAPPYLWPSSPLPWAGSLSCYNAANVFRKHSCKGHTLC